MIKDSIIALFVRDLNKTKKEIEAYKNEADLWLVPDGINNTAGNLALHISGNLQHFIGHVLGKSDYVRQRDAEFGDKNVPKSNILADIDAAILSIEHTLGGFSEKTLSDAYPHDVFVEPLTTGHFLIHLHGHLNYHLGQINYHRRLLAKG